MPSSCCTDSEQGSKHRLNAYFIIALPDSAGQLSRQALKQRALKKGPTRTHMSKFESKRLRR
jgi:hypothetical protein